jgi:putative FmdB family regulatory protein
VPVYDYVCTACATRIEVIHGVTESGPAACTACGGMLRKALTTPAIVFKGSGWAKMDARKASSSASGRKSDSADSPAKPEASTSDSSAKGDGGAKGATD